MPRTMTLNLRAMAGVITAWVAAVLIVDATVVAVLGLARAWLERRRPQVVIHNVELDEGVPAEAAAGLSRQLRENVRRELRQQSGDATHAQMETVDEDIAPALVPLLRATPRIPPPCAV